METGIWRGRVLWRVWGQERGGYIHPHTHLHIQLKKLGIPHTHTHNHTYA